MIDWIREITLVKRSVSRIAVSFICLLILPLTIISCGNGDGDSDGGPSDIPIFPPTVFMAAKEVAGTVELYASFDDGREIIKLNAQLVPGREVVNFKVSPDGILVAYLADQDTDEQFELYTVPVDGGTAVKVSALFRSASDVQDDFKWAPDSSRIAYRANQVNLDNIELFSVLPDGTSNRRVSISPLFANGNVDIFKWAPNSAFIAYTAQRTNLTQFELFSTRPTREDNFPISNLPVIDSSVQRFNWAPNSSRIAYIADRLIDEKFELFTNVPTGADNQKVSGNFFDAGDVFDFAWEPDSLLIAYSANQLREDKIELFVSSAASNIGNLRVSGTPMNGAGVADLGEAFDWAPNSSRIAYIADQNTAGEFELFTSTSSGSQNDLVSGELVEDGNVQAFLWQPNSFGIAYIADQDTHQKIELYTSPNDINDGNVKVSGTPMAGDGVTDFKWALNSSRIAYSADQNTPDVLELFTSTPDGKVNDIVSGTSMAGAGVAESGTGFAWAADSSGVGYIADQDTDEVFELFASQPDGSDNTQLSGDLVVDGDVFAFEWVP